MGGEVRGVEGRRDQPPHLSTRRAVGGARLRSTVQVQEKVGVRLLPSPYALLLLSGTRDTLR